MEQAQIAIAVEVDAKKETIRAEEAWERLQQASRVLVGKGKMVQEYLPDQAEKEALMGVVLGRSGNLRAPALQIGDRYYIGYNEGMYKKLTEQL